MRTILNISLVLVLAVCGYLVSYFAMVQRDWGDANCGCVYYYPAYRFSGPWPCGLVGTIYEPAHRLDRRFLRTTLWAEKQHLLALIAAELAHNGQLRATNSSPPNQHLQATPQ